MRLSPNGETLAISFVEKEDIQLWNVRTGKLAKVLRCPLGHFLDFSPDGRFLAAAADEEFLALAAMPEVSCRVWDLRTGALSYSLKAGGMVTFAAHGKLLLFRRDRELQVFDVATRKLTSKIDWKTKIDRSQPAAVSADARTYAIESGHGAVRCWDLASGKEYSDSNQHSMRILSIALDKPAKTWRTASLDGTVRSWDSVTGKHREVVDLPGSSLAPGGKWAARVHPFEQLLSLSDLADSKKPARVFKNVVDHQFAATGELVMRQVDNQFVSFNMEQNRGKKLIQLKSLDAGNWVLSPNWRWIAAPLLSDPSAEIGLWDLRSGRIVRHFAGKAAVPLALSPDGRFLARGGKEIQIFEIHTEKVIHRFSNPFPSTSMSNVLAFSPLGRVLAYGDRNGSVSFWDVVSGRELGKHQGHLGEVTCIYFTEDGRFLASGGADTTVVVWNLPRLNDNPRQLNQKELTELWEDLASDDANRAYRAMGVFLQAPKQAADFMQARLRPVQAIDREVLQKLLAVLDDPDFNKREKAVKNIAEFGDLAAGELREFLAAKGKSLEAKQRAAKLLERAEGPVVSKVHIRALRAIHALETIGDDGSPVLETMATGAVESRVTQEAQHSLQRRLGKPSDKDMLQGMWKVTAAKTGRPVQEQEIVAMWAFRFEGDTMTLIVDGQNLDKQTFQLDPKTKPKQINLYLPTGSNPEVPLLGIYAIEGDRLKLSWSKIDGKFRPESFELAPGNKTRQVSLELERVNK
ncbi:MAG: TIGR03067 domain-containing protein [Gemmataceae bacterium]|nr:TIGR03067 domain-containing protein [Gemmataceae bacterium]